MIKKFLLELFFPKFCFNCQKEGSYLCEDCKSLIGVLQIHQRYSGKNLKDLYWAAPYTNPLIKNLIQKFKYEPFVRNLSKSLSSLIIEHFQLLDNKPGFFNFSPYSFLSNEPNQKEYIKSSPEFILIPVPLEKRKLKWRGFNQAEEISKELSIFLKIPVIRDCLLKIKETIPQVELLEKERERNVLGAFLVRNENRIKERRILLVDDIYTTGSTMEECARVLKEAGVKEVIGIVIARG